MTDKTPRPGRENDLGFRNGEAGIERLVGGLFLLIRRKNLPKVPLAKSPGMILPKSPKVRLWVVFLSWGALLRSKRKAAVI